MHEDGHVLVALDGEWDLARAAELGEAIAKALAVAREGDALIFDLTEVTFVDSTIIAALHEGAVRASSRGIPFAVVCAGGPVRRVFDLVQLDVVVPIGSTVGEALERTRAARAC